MGCVAPSPLNSSGTIGLTQRIVENYLNFPSSSQMIHTHSSLLLGVDGVQKRTWKESGEKRDHWRQIAHSWGIQRRPSQTLPKGGGWGVLYDAWEYWMSQFSINEKRVWHEARIKKILYPREVQNNTLRGSLFLYPRTTHDALNLLGFFTFTRFTLSENQGWTHRKITHKKNKTENRSQNKMGKLPKKLLPKINFHIYVVNVSTLCTQLTTKWPKMLHL